MWLNLELHMPSSYRHMGQRCLNERCGQYGRNVLGSRANRRSFDCAVLTPGFAQDDNIVGGQTARDAVGATIAAIE
jgi:hypothetical protein